MSKRAFRRHHRQRIINKFKRITAHWYMIKDHELWAKKTAARGSIGCGCVMCANPRRNGWDTPETRKEHLADFYLKHWSDEH